MTAEVGWLTQSMPDLPSGLDWHAQKWLADEERVRLAAMRIAKRRADFALGRWTAKRAIAAWMATAPPLDALAVRAAADGAPEAYLGGVRLPLTVSLSHSAGRALAAVRDGSAALGADLERGEPRSPLLVDEFFTSDEAARIRARPADDRDRAITALWSAKESALKARRSGLREDPRRIGVELGLDAAGAPDGAWRAMAIAVDGSPAGLTGWWCDDAGYVITVAGEQLAAPPRRLVAPRRPV